MNPKIALTIGILIGSTIASILLLASLASGEPALLGIAGLVSMYLLYKSFRKINAI